MIRFLENYSLGAHNTFGIDVKAGYFFEFTDIGDLVVFLKSNSTWKEEKLFILGGGSNLLFTQDYNGVVIHPNVPGINIINEDRQNVWIEVGAGENWDEFVQYCVFNGFSGLENLSNIPGNIGAVPVQNIGAYGCEVKSFIETVKGFDIHKMIERQIPAEECDFGYRDSIFKKKLKERFIITSVVFKLDKFPEFNLAYGDVKDEVNKLGDVNLINIRQAIINIRTSKLPDKKVFANAGSFFKNPVIGVKKADELKKQFADMPYYRIDEDNVKLAAGWLIDKCGWKGYRNGDTGVHDKQALVIVNYGSATGKDIVVLSEKIKLSVSEQFGIDLEPEVTII